MTKRLNYERLEAKIQPETKRLAERAALVSGVTLTDYLIKLIHEDAPKTLKAHTEIKLTNDQFDKFLSICNSDRELSNELKTAAKLLDDEGF